MLRQLFVQSFTSKSSINLIDNPIWAMAPFLAFILGELGCRLVRDALWQPRIPFRSLGRTWMSELRFDVVPCPQKVRQRAKFDGKHKAMFMAGSSHLFIFSQNDVVLMMIDHPVPH